MAVYIGYHSTEDLQQLGLVYGVETCLHIDFDKIQLRTVN